MRNSVGQQWPAVSFLQFRSRLEPGGKGLELYSACKDNYAAKRKAIREGKRQDSCFVILKSYITAENRGYRRGQRRFQQTPLQEPVKMELDGHQERRTSA